MARTHRQNARPSAAQVSVIWLAPSTSPQVWSKEEVSEDSYFKLTSITDYWQLKDRTGQVCVCTCVCSCIPLFYSSPLCLPSL